jgi:ABC-type multidrug transport system fused ATPase/permease subunit
VWFAYNREEWVLRDVSFTIPKGGKLGLVGPSGSGKSTVVSLLCCFYRPGKGCIYVDGIPLQEIDLFTWRRQIGLILQDIFVFPGNITENVRVYNDDIAESEVKQAIGIVQLDSFIENLPQGMETELAERGQNISQGEKQLLSFARALAFSPDLIIMDEATASIDSVTEAKIQNTITKVLHNKTAVIVAHRLSSILDANEILYFKEGQVHRRGNHSQLWMSARNTDICLSCRILKPNLPLRKRRWKMPGKNNKLVWMLEQWEKLHWLLPFMLLFTLISNAAAIAYPLVFRKLMDLLANILSNPSG